MTIDRFDPMFTTHAMAHVFSQDTRFQRMLDVEAALARAEADVGLIPHEAAAAISAACKVEHFDVDSLLEQAAVAGTPVIPLVRELTALVDEDARGYVHRGATSQDIIDSAMMLQLRGGLELIESDLEGVARACARLAAQHRKTPMVARTLLQHALPTTFGLKAAYWLDLITRCVTRLRSTRENELVIALGGAAGTLASLGDEGPRVAASMGHDLSLAVPDLPWHQSRDRVVIVATDAAVAAGAAAKIATDVALLQQPEIGEVSEGRAPGKGTSSAMPHKRNPIDAVAAIASARLAGAAAASLLPSMVQEHERSIGSWQAEWVSIPALFLHAGGAVARGRSVVENLEVNPDRMQANLELTRGLVMAEALAGRLAPGLGRTAAHDLVESLCELVAEGTSTLREAAAGDPRVTSVVAADELDGLLDPLSYRGSSNTFIDRALEAFEKMVH